MTEFHFWVNYPFKRTLPDRSLLFKEIFTGVRGVTTCPIGLSSSVVSTSVMMCVCVSVHIVKEE